jgi:IS1 family transposase
MTFHIFLFLLAVCLLLSLALLWRLGWIPLQPSHSAVASRRSPVPRLLKPRSPVDCPVCCLASTPSSSSGSAPAPVRPWREVKSRRGARHPRQHRGLRLSEPAVPVLRDHRCPLPCAGRRWQAWSCRAHPDLSLSGLPHHLQCSTPHSLVRFENPFAPDRHGAVRSGRRTRCFCGRTRLRLSASHHHSLVVSRWRARSILARALLPQSPDPHIQLDELRTRLRCSTHVLWLWLAIDPLTKILPVLQLGPRTQNMAHLLIHSLRQILAPGCLPLFTSDGLNLYFYSITAHFGQWLALGHRGRNARQWQVEAGLIYGQVKKTYRRRKLVRVSSVMRLGTEAALKVALQGLGFSGRLNTAFIERVNLTIRHGIAALARRTWATAQQSPQLLAHLEWWRAYYHFVRPHASLRVSLVQPRERGGKLLAQRYRHRTPAMAAGRTNRPWTAGEVLSCPLPKVSA